MSREAIEIGAFTWSRMQRLYEPDPTGEGSGSDSIRDA